MSGCELQIVNTSNPATVEITQASSGVTLASVAAATVEITAMVIGGDLTAPVPATVTESVSTTSVELSAQGVAGPTGPAGLSDEMTFSRIAAVNLSGHRVVTPLPDGTVTYADSSVLANATRPMWLTVGSALAGDSVELVAIGDISEPSWNWTSGRPIYLGQNGVLTQTGPSPENGDAFILQLASSDTATDIFYDPKQAIALATY